MQRWEQWDAWPRVAGLGAATLAALCWLPVLGLALLVLAMPEWSLTEVRPGTWLVAASGLGANLHAFVLALRAQRTAQIPPVLALCVTAFLAAASLATS